MTRKEFEEKRDAAEKKLDEGYTLLEELATGVRDHFDEKGEKWQESAKGQEFSELADTIEEKQGEAETLKGEVAGFNWPNQK